MHVRTTAVTALIFAILLQVRAQSAPPTPSDAEIRSILAERVDKYKQSVGIAVGIIDASGRRVISYGKLAANDPRPVNGDTVFEIGSITKVFTSLLLLDMAERHEVAVLDPVAKYLPGVKIPELDGEEITLQDLVTHVSGLPRMPMNVDPKDPANPYADYSSAQLYEFLARYELQRPVGARFEYSNLGVALLGQALVQRAGMNYEALVRNRIADPLGMKSTSIALTPEMKTNLAGGHAYALEPTSNWDMGALGAAAALRSTANDMLTFLAANLGYTETRLAPAMTAMTKVRRTVDRRSVALGWFSEIHDNVQIFFYSGSTGGYLSFMGYDPKARVGVIVLSNSGTGAGVDDIGIHLLSPGTPLLDGNSLKPAKERRETTIDPRLLDSYAGRYQFPSGQMATVTRDGNHLLMQGQGEVKIVFYAEDNRRFFAKLVDAQMTFDFDSRSQVTEMIFSRSGEDLTVRRIGR